MGVGITPLNGTTSAGHMAADLALLSMAPLEPADIATIETLLV